MTKRQVRRLVASATRRVRAAFVRELKGLYGRKRTVDYAGLVTFTAALVGDLGRLLEAGSTEVLRNLAGGPNGRRRPRAGGSP